MDKNRRAFLRGTSLATAGWMVTSTNSAQAQTQGDGVVDEAAGGADVERYPRRTPGPGGPLGSAADRGKLVPGRRDGGQPPVAVQTPDVPKLEYEMDGPVKVYRLAAEHLQREVLPEKWLDFWGYNGTMPGPTIEAVEGDRVRIVVENRLPESTTVHWHGFELPMAMDGVEFLTQRPIAPGATFTYEFDLHQNGTFFYHSHGPMQQSIGLVGMFIVHPRAAWEPVVDRDFALLLQEFALLPKQTVPDTLSEEFNLFTINGRAGPYVTPLLVRLGERVRLRFVNLSTMDHHPMHLHGHTFWNTGTEAGRIPPTAWVPENTVLVGSGQSRDVEFIANNPGDWLLHCHIPHHMMNMMVPMVGPMPGHNAGGAAAADDARWRVPGYPQDMMDMPEMFDEFQRELIHVPESRGMPRDWHRAVKGMMTVLRVLPDDEFQRLGGNGGSTA